MLAVAKPLRYIFYRILMWKLKDATEVLPVYAAACITLVLIGSNVILIYMLIANLTDRSTAWMGTWAGIGRSGAYAIAAVLLIAFARLMTYAWVDEGRINKLVREFETTSQRRLIFRTILFWSYAIASMLFPVVVVLILRSRK